MEQINLMDAWELIPTGAENAISRTEMAQRLNTTIGGCKRILHKLNAMDNGDNFIIVRSSKKGIFKTDDVDEIRAYKGECISMGFSTALSPLRKINRVLGESGQMVIDFDDMPDIGQ